MKKVIDTVPRLDDEIIHRILKKLLKENICRNRGYILDGYPRSFKDSEGIFCDIDENKPEEDPNRLVLNAEITPNRVLFIGGHTNEFLINRVKALNITQKSHYDEFGMKRRLEKFKLFNESPNGELCLRDFYLRKKIDLLDINCKEQENKLLEQAKVFLEKVTLN
jgi:adenylate kinase